MAMRVAGRPARSYVFFGARFPAVVVWLTGIVLVGSCVGALFARLGIPGLEWLLLQPKAVLAGQAWRLLTWSFFELQPLGLIFGCLALAIFGRDLSDVWGPRRFLLSFAVLTAVTGALTTLIGLAWPDVRQTLYLSVWPIVEAFIIAWATLFPSRQMLVYFVIPLGGRNLIYATLGGTLIFALLGGFSYFVPHFVAQGLMLLYLREPGIARFWQRFTLRMRGGGKRRSTHLRAVERFEREDEPPRWLH